MFTVDSDGVAIAYETRGPATPERNAETVVFLEGLGYGRWMWRWQAAALSSRYEVVLLDNRGTGDSDAPDGPYSIAQMAADVDAVLSDLDVDEAHVVGASMGGMIAQRYALDFDRTTSLSLLCTSHGGPEAVPTPPETKQRMFDVPDDADEREVIRYKMRPAMTDAFFESRDDLVSRIVDWRLASDAPEHARTAQAEAVAAFDSSDELAALDVPTLVLHGTEDRVLPVENGQLLADEIAEAADEAVVFEEYDGGSHLFFIEQAGAVNDRLATFLNNV
ncbi:alpha/beta fold hydrolase [Halogeometricum borinquense]|uniref:Alpha/beta fold hydrolase n=1 Tax=Halogeometricum borinquense TaxID=60847 RepID=A0A6C0UGS2_9EURY|nr:alpha/beta hydrolase [Halogeometricum borinquense]QIB74696.1 alpha/beta fold hydrolase [Halogeometricum borinquense]QIQ76349.1 alpha/beta fold hydrolase [Halogeometricum borinquense]